MRWLPYSGSRIAAAGHRTFVDDPPTMRFGPSPRRYGYVWTNGDSFLAYHEIPRPGQIEDAMLGSFATARGARTAVEQALLAGVTRS